MPSNRVQLRGVLAERGALRFTPAGVPMIDALLRHASEQREAGSLRKVELEVATVFAGPLAEPASRLALGTELRVCGFLAPRRRQSKLLALHATEFELTEV